MSCTGKGGDSTNKTSSNEEASWKEQDKANRQSISDAPGCAVDAENIITIAILAMIG